MKKAFLISMIASVLLFAAGCGSNGDDGADGGQLKGTITLSGAWALYPMVVKWAEQFQVLHPQVRIDVSAGGAGKGMADALSKAVDLGMVSRDIYPEEIQKGACWFSVTKDAVVPTCNENNPHRQQLLRRGVTRKGFAGIWVRGDIKTWDQVTGGGETQPIHVYTRSDACGAAKTWAEFLGASQEDLQGVGVYGDPGLAEAVIKDELGIGYNNINYAYDTATKQPLKPLAVIPIDLNGNGQVDPEEDFYADRDGLIRAIQDGVYPSPPARPLHLVSRGCPQRRVVREFIRWICTDGQQYIPESGYIQLPADMIQQELAKLDAPAP